MSLRIGYSFHGFLADRKLDADLEEVSTPDGNATYSWSIVWEAMRRGHSVVPLQQDRDRAGISEFGEKMFKAFSQKKRCDVYEHLFYGIGGSTPRKSTGLNGWRDGTGELGVFPELDVVLIEWRWPIVGRNTPEAKGKEWYQPDLERQLEILQHYSGTKTRVIIWDLDHKFSPDDEARWDLDAIFETSVKPLISLKTPRTRVEPPFVIDDLLQHPTQEAPHIRAAYIGSRYERDLIVDEWIKPYAAKNPARVHFHGKWEPKAELEARWPGIRFHDRIGVSGFKDAYSASSAVPLLAKESYRATGFMTPRVWESILFGSIPVGLRGHNGIEEYCKIIAESPDNLEHCLGMMGRWDLKQRDEQRRQAAERLRFMDVSNFVDRIESVVG